MGRSRDQGIGGTQRGAGIYTGAWRAREERRQVQGRLGRRGGRWVGWEGRWVGWEGRWVGWEGGEEVGRF